MRKAIQQLEEEIELLKNQIEELNEDLQDAKNNYKCLEWHNNNQYNLLNKYKKVIEMLKRDLDLYLDPTLLTLNNENQILIILNEEDYKLLKEVLG